MSSLVTGSSPFFSSRGLAQLLVDRPDQRPLEAATCVPPLGVAITLTKDRTVVS